MKRELLKEVLKDERLFGLFLNYHPVAAFRDDLELACYTTAEGPHPNFLAGASSSRLYDVRARDKERVSGHKGSSDSCSAAIENASNAGLKVHHLIPCR